MWQSLLRNWIWSAVKSAATSSAAGPSKAADRPGRPCDVGLVFALPQESNRLVDRMRGVVTTHGAGFVAKSGRLGEKQIVVINSGAGREAAYRATDALITAHRPRLIISTGFAGGLHEDLNRGDFLFANEVISAAGRRLTIELKLDQATGDPSRSIHVGRLVTADRLVTTPAGKKALHVQLGAMAVDLETIAVADACRSFSTPLLAIRIISDAVDEALPRDIERLMNKPTRVRQVGFALGTMFRRPSSAKDLWHLQQTASTLSERLAKLLIGVVEQLPAATPHDVGLAAP